MALQGSPNKQGYREIFYTNHDGLRLFARHYPNRGASQRPLLCLPGLTRNSADFHAIASYLNQPEMGGREIYALDYRGRGLSEHDADWKNYTPFIEMLDVQNFLALEQVHQPAILGTSRGGIITMLMAVASPAHLGPVILNDIGPKLEVKGLLRIMAYVGNTPVPQNWQQAGEILQNLFGSHFPVNTIADWIDIAQCIYLEKEGNPFPSYDPKLGDSIRAIDITEDLPEMWPQFEALKNNPCLVIRGENSDLLSEETVDRMSQLHPKLERLLVRNEGHAPWLRDKTSQERIRLFLNKHDQNEKAN